jgi:hypothetical protein
MRIPPIVATIIVLVCSTVCTTKPVERRLTGRTPEEVLLSAAVSITPADEFYPRRTRTDSTWLYNAELTKIGKVQYLVWLESRWWVTPDEQKQFPLGERHLVEIDCGKHVFKEGEQTGAIPDSTRPWQVPEPRSIDAVNVDSACAYLMHTA